MSKAPVGEKKRKSNLKVVLPTDPPPEAVPSLFRASTGGSRRPSELIEELKQSAKPPPGRVSILPRVYEYWTDEDELEQDEGFDEEGNLQKRKVGDNEEEDILQYLYEVKPRKERAAECQAKYEEFRKREAEERLREIEIQRLEDLKFPTKMGFFYTDGYYESPPFGIRPNLVEEYIQKEQVFREKLAKSAPKESFTEKFKKHFWPPSKYYGCGCLGQMFRTRGSYLDFKEIDPKKIPSIEVDLERTGVEILSNKNALFRDDDIYAEGDTGLLQEEEEEEGKEEEEVEEEEGGEGVKKTKKSKKVKGANMMGINVIAGGVGWEEFYYDDDEGEFHPKIIGLDVDYYFDGENTCWRRKRGKKKSDDQTTPYDFYYHEGAFYPRETYQGKHDLDIVYDPAIGIWKYEPQISTRALVQRGEYMAKDKSIRKLDTTGQTTGSVVALPKEAKKKALDAAIKEEGYVAGGSPATTGQDKDKPVGPGPKEFYFDETDTFWKKKEEVDPNEITWDEMGRRWIKRAIGDWRGLTGFSPDDFYWAADLGKFQLRTKKQPDIYQYNHSEGIWLPKKAPKKLAVVKSSPTEFFFEDGMFKAKEPLRDYLYRRLRYGLIFKRRDQPKSGLYAEDFYYDYEKKMWLPRSVRMALLKTKEEDLPWTKIDVDKKKPKAGLPTEDDFWFDIEEGVFVKKETSAAAKDKYYFDHKEQVWKNNDQKDLSKLKLLPSDYYFNGKEFKRRGKTEAESTYTYDNKTGVYWLASAYNKNNADKDAPNKYYFDYETEIWKVNSGGGESTSTQDSSGRFVKIDTARPSPHDYYWDDSLGRFFKKEEDETQYFYTVEPFGVFKLANVKPYGNPKGFTPKHFYFDENERTWRLKVVGHEKEYIWDRNNHIFRHVVSQDTKSGLKASDYYFNTFLGTWMAIANFDKARGTILNEKLNWAPSRVYNKPWLEAAPQRYSQTPGTRQKPEVWSGVQEKPFSRPGYMADGKEKEESGTTGTAAAIPVPEPSKKVTKIRMTNFDTAAVTEADLKEIFPQATKIELQKEQGIAIITFANAENAVHARESRDGTSFKGKNIILEDILED